MSKWYPVGLPIRDFVREFKPGMMIEVEAEHGPQARLIGNYNAVGGLCGMCCNLDECMTLVIRYRMINWEKP